MPINLINVKFLMYWHFLAVPLTVVSTLSAIGQWNTTQGLLHGIVWVLDSSQGDLLMQAGWISIHSAPQPIHLPRQLETGYLQMRPDQFNAAVCRHPRCILPQVNLVFP